MDVSSGDIVQSWAVPVQIRSYDEKIWFIGLHQTRISVSDNWCTEISRKSMPIFDLILNIRFEINNFVSNRIEFEALDDLWLS